VPCTHNNSNIRTNVTYSTNTNYWVESFTNIIADVLHITRFQLLNFYTRMNLQWQLLTLLPLTFTFRITDYASLHHLWAQVHQPTCYASSVPNITSSLTTVQLHEREFDPITKTFKTALLIILQTKLVEFHVKILSLFSPIYKMRQRYLTIFKYRYIANDVAYCNNYKFWLNCKLSACNSLYLMNFLYTHSLYSLNGYLNR
jgi:hypothetical protein